MAKSLLPIINRKISSIAKSSANIADIASDTAIMAVSHARQHGDFTPMARLVEVVPADKMKKAILAFFRDFSPVAFSYREGRLHASRHREKDFSPVPADVRPAAYQPELTPEQKKAKTARQASRQAKKEAAAAAAADMAQKAAMAESAMAEAARAKTTAADARDEARAVSEELELARATIARLERENESLRATIARMSQAVVAA